MTNAYLDFGTITISAANTAAYGTNEILLDNPKYFAGVPAKVVFTATAAVTGFTPALYSGDTTAPTNAVAKSPSAVTLAVGESVELSIPAILGKYLRAGGSATGTSGAVTACIELGAPRA